MTPQAGSDALHCLRDALMSKSGQSPADGDGGNGPLPNLRDTRSEGIELIPCRLATCLSNPNFGLVVQLGERLIEIADK